MTENTHRWHLTPEDVTFFKENGFVLVKRVFSAEEASRYREEAHDLAYRLERAEDQGFRNEGWQRSARITDLPRELLECHNAQFHSAAFSRLITDPRLTDRAADLIGPNVMLHHTKMFIKPPETGTPFPMHQDIPHFPFKHHSMIAAIIHFDDAPIEKGCIRVMPGSHRQGWIEHIAEGGYHLPPDQYPLANATPCPASAGDVLFFSYLTIHGSGANNSSEARTTLLVQMRDPTDVPMEVAHLSRGQGMMLRGVDPTADATSSLRSSSRAIAALKNAEKDSRG